LSIFLSLIIHSCMLFALYVSLTTVINKTQNNVLVFKYFERIFPLISYLKHRCQKIRLIAFHQAKNRRLSIHLLIFCLILGCLKRANKWNYLLSSQMNENNSFYFDSKLTARRKNNWSERKRKWANRD